MEQGLSSSGDIRPQQELNKALVPGKGVPQTGSDVKRSDRLDESVSNHALLANAFEGVTMSLLLLSWENSRRLESTLRKAAG